jgi:glycosyltransferase involved in cell wall biosynthesis
MTADLALAGQVLVVIPAYNEEEAVAGVVRSLREAAPEFDRVVVNDGSTDGTGRVVAELGERQLELSCNLGYGQALQTGLQYALARGYEIVVTMDADGQHRAEDVPRLVRALVENNADMVIGSRFCDGSPYDRRASRGLGQRLFSYLTSLLVGRRIFDTSSGFKALRAESCRVLVNGIFLDFHTEAIVQLSLAGLRIIEVPLTVQARLSGRSMYNVSSIVHYPLKTVLLTMAAFMDALLIRRTR